MLNDTFEKMLENLSSCGTHSSERTGEQIKLMLLAVDNSLLYVIVIRLYLKKKVNPAKGSVSIIACSSRSLISES